MAENSGTKYDREGAKDLPAGPGFLLNLWHSVGLLFWVVLFRVFNRIRVVHPENRPGRGEFGVLLCANHISALDPFIIAAAAMPFFSPVWWRAPAKEELFRIPVLRSLLASWGAFPVRRGRGDLDAIDRMARLVHESVIVIFPEGTRSKDGGLQPGKAGVGKIIHDAQTAKVTPVYIAGSDRLLPRGRFLPRLGRTVTLVFGPAVDFSRDLAEPPSLGLSGRIAAHLMEEIGRLQGDLPKRSP